jgi:hypothetical protein
MSSAKIYNEKRRIIFSAYHNRNPDTAFEWLEGYRSILGHAGYVGLKAELEFYHKHRHQFSLTVAGDMGEHADFSGQMGRSSVRFDVTTNLRFKQLATYEKFICDGFDYKIAILDNRNWEIIDVLELAFPRCEACGGSFCFPLAVMGPQNYNRHGDPLWHSDQEIVDFCPSCGEMEKRLDLHNSSLLSPTDLYNEASTFDDDDDAEKYLDNELRGSVKYLEKATGIQLVGLAAEGVQQLHKYADEERGLYFPYLSGVVKRQFPDFYTF